MERIDRFLRFPGGKFKALTLSYDDGCVLDGKLIQLMKKAGIKGTFNISTNCFRPDDAPLDPSNAYQHMTLEESLKTYDESICEIAIHGYDHLDMSGLDSASVCAQIIDDRRGLEKIFGRQIRGMAYPYGVFNDTIAQIIDLCGIRYSRTVISSENFIMPKSKDEWLRLPATCHHKNPKLMELCDQFLTLPNRRKPQMFYLWGHTYEFNVQNNWHVIEAFFEKMKGHDDIWYATNMEIYQAWEDFQRLEASADGRTIHNPNLRTVWFATFKGDVHELKPGETITLE